jgi:2'-5' RNA ligase
MRLFVGIALAPEVLSRLTAAVAQLRQPGDGLRWTAPVSWHITLQFLGEASPEQCYQLLESLASIRAAPFLMQLEGIGCWERAGVVCVGVRLSPELEALERQVVVATEVCGFRAERRAFRPHITLARARGSQAQRFSNIMARAPRWVGFDAFPAQEFRLYESFLEPSGARYQVRGRFPLAAKGV